MAMYATLSHSKLTSWSSIADAHGHNARLIDVPNADPKKLGVFEVVNRPEQSLSERIKGRIKEAGVAKIRDNAVLAFEDIFGASPGYWESQFPGGWENATVDQLLADPLVKAVEQFARIKHGENLVSVAWHFDEKSPHAHVVSVPIVTREHRKRGRKRKDGLEDLPVVKSTLAAHELRGGSKYTLEKEHTEWAAFVAHLGLIRGRKGSEMTSEDRQERRLRDPQASRQGEEAARKREELIELGRKGMLELIRSGGEQKGNLVSEGMADRNAAKEELETAQNHRREALKLYLDMSTKHQDQITEIYLMEKQAKADRDIAQKERIKASEDCAAAEVMLEKVRKSAENQRLEALEQMRGISQLESQAKADRDIARKERIKASEDRAAAEVMLEKVRKSAENQRLEALEQMRGISQLESQAKADRDIAQKERIKASEDRAAAEVMLEEAEKTKNTVKSHEIACEVGMESILDGRILRGDELENGQRTITFKAMPEAEKIELKKQISPAWIWVSRQAERMQILRNREAEVSRLETTLTNALKSAKDLISKYTKAYAPLASWVKKFDEAAPVIRQAMKLSPQGEIAEEARKSAIQEVNEDDKWLETMQSYVDSGLGR